MIKFISSWAGGIVLSVIIATILEMILPEGKNKKYIKTVIGVYILFAIISPIISKVTGKTIDTQRIFEIEDILEQNTIEVSSVNTTNSIEKMYTTNLKQDIKAKIEEKGYQVNKVNVLVETKDEKNYGKIHEITLHISQKKQKENTLTPINKIKIEIANTNNEIVVEENKMPNYILMELKEYLSGVYDIEKEKIKINEDT